MQMAIFSEGGMAPDAIDRYAQKLGVVFLELGKNLVVERFPSLSPQTGLQSAADKRRESPAGRAAH